VDRAYPVIIGWVGTIFIVANRDEDNFVALADYRSFGA
jgi:hypothetical protein